MRPRSEKKQQQQQQMAATQKLQTPKIKTRGEEDEITEREIGKLGF